LEFGIQTREVVPSYVQPLILEHCVASGVLQQKGFQIVEFVDDIRVPEESEIVWPQRGHPLVSLRLRNVLKNIKPYGGYHGQYGAFFAYW
jgi:hypothetical protein